MALFMVEVPAIAGELNGQMNRMRAWLDHQRYEPSAFRVSTDGVGAGVCRVGFNNEDEAAAFIQEFGGRLISAQLAGDAIRQEL